MTITRLPTPVAHEPPPGCVTAMDVVDRAGISYRKLDYWTRTGRLHPIGDITPGSGSPRYYPLAELAAATLMGRLVDDGLLPDAAHDHARRLLDEGSTTIAGITIHLPQDT